MSRLQGEHGGNISAAVEFYNLNREDVIDFSANINFLGPPEQVIEAVKRNIYEIANYPEPNSNGLKQIIADRQCLEPENIIVGNGAVELIYQFVKVLKPTRALVVTPTFSEYSLALEAVDCQINYLKLQEDVDFKLDIPKLKPLLAQNEAVFICNPNNPTGSMISKADLYEIVNLAEKNGTYILLDEAFIHFIDEPCNHTMISEVIKSPNLFVLRSLTKIYAIPGLRLGYGVGQERLVSSMEVKRDPWTVNYFAQLAGEVIFTEREYYKKSQRLNLQERDYFYQELKSFAQFMVYPPAANFILLNLKETDYNSLELYNHLAQRGILIRNCSNLRGLNRNFVRFAVKSRQENMVLLKELRNLFF